ncbi:MAG: PD-(D/E)XK nuclease family protein [Prevotella sp.]|nr:PD-(D/E)XK nuclease family protein [Prevotella sp.]
MKTFLEYVAEDILNKYGTDLSRVAVVFPNKRASLFLNEHLARLSGKPIWSPAYITISDLFRRHSRRTVADPIKLVCDLHKSFTAQTGIDETLDHFYGWGQLLLADFDDLDKNMADADSVFRNLRDIHELDDVSYLTDEQKEAISRFFSNFSDEHNTLLKERFLKLWSKMGDIYHDFNQRLSHQGLAYEGALYREVASSVSGNTIATDYDTYLFVGFNLVQPVEQRLFSVLKKEGKAYFYWDFDLSYMKDNEAGHYIGQYLADFPNEFDTSDEAIYDQYAQQKDIRFVSSTTENAQAHYVGQWLRQGGRIEAGQRTAVVMCNEALLPTIIHCLPNEVEKVNITTGYPLMQSPIASLVNALVNLRTLGYDQQRQRFRHRYLTAVMRNPYIAQLPAEEAEGLVTSDDVLLPWLCRILQRIALADSGNDPLYQESVFRAYTLINRLKGLTDSGDLLVDSITMQRLINQLMQSTSVPFHGEPAEGLQVMGVLETRNLDFDHVVLLSCNEGNMPRGVSDTSFIPYSIRKAYGLTTIDHKVAIYSYYFHRLLQRASDVAILYNNSTTDGQTGEMSRFMLQMMVEDQHHDIRFETLQVPAALPHSEPPVIRLDKKRTTDFLSPTAINAYLRCPLRYYYKYECGLLEPEEDDDDTIDNRAFGNIFHKASQTIYERLMQKSRQILASDIEQLLKTRVDIERAVDEAMQEELNSSSELSGLQIINREVIIHYLRQLLEIDRRLAPFSIIGLECDVKGTIQTPHITTTIGGIIDRLDCIVKDGQERIRVVDYKTGSHQPKPLADVDAVFQQENLKNHSDYYLQTILYATLVKADHPQTPVSPALLFIQHAGADDYDPTLCFGKEPIADIASDSTRFMELLNETIDQMFNPAVPYTPTEDRDRCRNCPYRLLCNQ